MPLTPKQIASILKLRAIGWYQKEIAETIGVSQQVIAYHLKKLRDKSRETDPEDVFSSALLGGLALGAGLAALSVLAELLTKGEE